MSKQDQQLDIYFLDVGQGDGTLLVLPDGTTMLVDLGCKKDPYNVISADAISSVQSVLGDSSLVKTPNCIDYLFVTHADADHYNLLPGLVGKLSSSASPCIGETFVGGRLTKYPAGLRTTIGQQTSNNRNLDPNNMPNPLLPDHMLNNFAGIVGYWQTNLINTAGVAVHVLSANGSLIESNKNSDSIVLLVQFGNTNVLLMGDAGNAIESTVLKLLQSGDLGFDNTVLPGCILKVGHHGSNTSSSSTWINSVAPSLVFMSSDTHTGYNHPDARMMLRVLGANLNAVTAHGCIAGNLKVLDAKSKTATRKTKTGTTLNKKTAITKLNKAFGGITPTAPVFPETTSDAYSFVGYQTTKGVFTTVCQLQEDPVKSNGFIAFGSQYLLSVDSDDAISVTGQIPASSGGYADTTIYDSSSMSTE